MLIDENKREMLVHLNINEIFLKILIKILIEFLLIHEYICLCRLLLVIPSCLYLLLALIATSYIHFPE